MSPITPRLLRTSALRNLTSSIRPAAARIAAGGYGRLGGYGRIAENPRTFTQTCQWRKEEGRVAPALDAKEAQGAQTESKLYSFEEVLIPPSPLTPNSKTDSYYSIDPGFRRETQPKQNLNRRPRALRTPLNWPYPLRYQHTRHNRARRLLPPGRGI